MIGNQQKFDKRTYDVTDTIAIVHKWVEYIEIKLH